ncbi:hypothetical protein [Sporotomaculum syntrophicum]|uniref:hypothetical protein n=1 Tax=Sporotomaculum syntrophicum TaxID=182264 RepID=UPI00137B42B8|nr:hypothetical protein [Sporotomaculum syntrophicum]
MKIDYAKYERLSEIENCFAAQIREKEISLLGDLVITQEQFNELTDLIRHVILTNQKAIQVKYALATAVFLVWCSVYYYKDGTFWDPIFSKLKIPDNLKKAEFLGETFLKVLKKFGLQKISATERTKKYMTPILMHGYISDHYAGKFLDYLNAIYVSYLKYNVTEHAMASLWTDLFNLHTEQISIKSEIEKLEKQENQIKLAIQKYSVPDILHNINRLMLTEHEENVSQLKQNITDILSKLSELDEEIERYQMIERELKEFRFILEGIKTIAPAGWADAALEQLVQFQLESSELVKHKLGCLNKQKFHIVKERKHFESQYAIETEKIITIKTNILTLGKGKAEEGWSILNDFQELKKSLEVVQAKLIQRREMHQMEDSIENLTVKQILTTSLTHLADENPTHFQSFIKSTLRMIDSVSKNQCIVETHRMYKPVYRWWNSLGKEKKESSVKPSSTDEIAQNGHLRKLRSNWRLERPKLRQPSLIYDTTERNLYLKIPEQQLAAPKDFYEEPHFILEYSDLQEKIEVNYVIEKNKMLIQEQKVCINRPDIKHLTFRCLSISEYWPISVEPVMLFNHKTKVMFDQIIPNGYYYILAQKNWQTDAQHIIIDQYVGGPDDYRIYEVKMDESEINFWLDTANNRETLTIQSSQFTGIELKGIQFVPGVFMEGTPVCYASSPVMTIGYKAIDTHQITFSLFYQGVLHIQSPIHVMFNRYGKQISPHAAELELEKILNNKAQPNVEKIQISITDRQGKEIFGRSFCRVRGLNFTFNTSEIVIKVPVGALLRHPYSIQDGTSYHIPISEQSLLEVEIYLKRLGWKTFQLESPIVQYELRNIENQKLNIPLCLLYSEAEKLKDISVDWSTSSDLPEKVILFDDAENLVSTFNLRNGQASAQLIGFYDIIRDLAVNRKIYFRWESKTRISPNFLLLEVFHKVEVTECTLYQTENEMDNLFEIRYKLNFPYSGQLMIRVRETENSNNILINQAITDNPCYVYINKVDTTAKLLTFELFYIQSNKSIFGNTEQEIICWEREEKRILKKAVVKEILKRGLLIKAFNYEHKQHLLQDTFCIEQITKENKHFAEEEIFTGIFKGKNISSVVYFCLDIEKQKLPFLIDTDYDGVQYHPVTGELFWECRSDPEIMAPLDDLEYTIKEDVVYEPKSGAFIAKDF